MPKNERPIMPLFPAGNLFSLGSFDSGSQSTDPELVTVPVHLAAEDMSGTLTLPTPDFGGYVQINPGYHQKPGGFALLTGGHEDYEPGTLASFSSAPARELVRPQQMLDGIDRTGPAGIRIGKVESLSRGGAIAYTSAGWVQIGLPMWSNRDIFTRYAQAGGFIPPDKPGFLPTENIPHVIPTHIFPDLDYTDETTGILPGDFDQYLTFVARGTQFTFIMKDAATAARTERFLRSSFRGPQDFDVDLAIKDEHEADNAGIPRFVAEVGTLSDAPKKICHVTSFTNEEHRLTDDVLVKKIAPMLYEVHDHGEMVARIDLKAHEWSLKHPSLEPDREVHHDGSFLAVREKFLVRGESGIWPIGTSDGFSTGKKESTAGHMVWNGGKCILVDPPSETVAYFFRHGIPLESISGIIVTHGHGDHFTDAVPQLLRLLPRINFYSTRTVYRHLRELYALGIGGKGEGLQQWNFIPVKPREFAQINGLWMRFHYTLHPVPALAYEIRTSPEVSKVNLVLYYSGDTFAEHSELEKRFSLVTDAERRKEILRAFELIEETWDQNPPPTILIEGGMKGIHTQFTETEKWARGFAERKGVSFAEVMERVRLYHMADNKMSGEIAAYKWKAGHEGALFFTQMEAYNYTDVDQIRRWFEQTPLLRHASPATLSALAAKAEIVALNEGQVLPPGFLTIPISGALEPVNEGFSERRVVQPFGLLGGEEVFGETASQYSAPMRARVPSHILRIPVRDAREILGVNPHSREKRALRADWLNYHEVTHVSTHAIENSRMKHLPESVLAPLLMSAYVQSYSPGEIIVLQGRRERKNEADIYLVLDGSVRVLKNNGKLNLLAGSGTLFGEMSFLRGSPRSATVKAENHVRVLRFSAKELRVLMREYPGIAIALNRLVAERRRAP